MPTIRMPDGTNVNFPDDMPAEQIHGMIQKKFPKMDLSPPDPGFLPQVGRDVRGFASGVESTVDRLAEGIPFVGSRDPTLTERVLAERTPPKEPQEAGFNVLGQIAPSFAIPATGAGATVGRAIGLGYPRLATIARAATEGGVQGGLGGAMMPGDRASNTDIGTATGAGIRGGGAAAQIGINAIPPKLKNTVAALAGIAAASKMGVPWWAMMFPHWSQQQGAYIDSLFRQFYDFNIARLADLAGKGIRQGTREVPAGPAGAFTAKELEKKDGRTD